MKTLIMALIVLGMVGAGFFVRAESLATAPATKPSTPPAKEVALDLGDKVALKLVLIPAGKFLMGSPETEQEREKDETLHEVTISQPFYLGVTHVTASQFAAFVKDTGQERTGPGSRQAGDLAVVSVNWDEAQAFCKWLSKKTGKTIQLPTEAQWEYACRAGSQTRFSFGDKTADLGDYAWYFGNTMDAARGVRIKTPVGQKKPNAWGLYDMHGNAWEWCADYYAPYAGPGTDPTGPAEGGPRVLRGGSWATLPWNCRSAYRFWDNPVNRRNSVGFRVAMVAADEERSDTKNGPGADKPRRSAANR